MSDWKPVLSDVPQSSVLGPLLFRVYINGLDTNIVRQVLHFTDDITLYSKVNRSNNDNNLQTALEKLEYSQRYKLEREGTRSNIKC